LGGQHRKLGRRNVQGEGKKEGSRTREMAKGGKQEDQLRDEWSGLEQVGEKKGKKLLKKYGGLGGTKNKKQQTKERKKREIKKHQRAEKSVLVSMCNAGPTKKKKVAQRLQACEYHGRTEKS